MPNPILAILVAAGLTAVLRFAPFLVFGGKRPVPAVVLYLGRVLPYPVMAMLVVYCLRTLSFSAVASYLPTVLGILCVAALQLLRRSTLVSVVGGTAVYMILVNFVF